MLAREVTESQAGQSEGMTRVRVLTCWLTIAACLPYVGLKLAWIFGSGIGGADEQMTRSSVVVANVVTMGMDLVAIVIVLAFTYRWGRRIPAWLVLVPMWVGTGLLAPIALGLPLGVLVQLIVGGSPAASGATLDGWVFAVVYGGFTLQAVGLTIAFALYARDRWAALFETTELRRGATHDLQLLIAKAGAVVATGFAGMQIAWAVTGGQLGGQPTAVETAAQKTFYLVRALIAVAGAVSLLVFVHGRSTWFSLAGAWVGTGFLFASGLFDLLIEPEGDVLRLTALAATLVGLLTGIAAILAAIDHLHAQSHLRPLGAVGEEGVEVALGDLSGREAERALVE